MKRIEVVVKDKVFLIKAQKLKNQIWFHFNGKIFVLDKQKKSSSAVGQKNEEIDEHLVLSPMPGQIVRVLVQQNDKVRDNQTLLILSSMKMEYTVKSPGKGVVKSVNVREGERVSADQELVEIARK